MIRAAINLAAMFLVLSPAMASAQSQVGAGEFFFACTIALVERDAEGSTHSHQVGPYHQLNALISDEIVPDDQHQISAKGPLLKVLKTYDPDQILSGKGFQYYIAGASGGGALFNGDQRLALKSEFWMLSINLSKESGAPNHPPFDAMLGHLGPNFHGFDKTNKWMGWCMRAKTKDTAADFDKFNDGSKHSLDAMNKRWHGQ